MSPSATHVAAFRRYVGWMPNLHRIREGFWKAQAKRTAHDSDEQGHKEAVTTFASAIKRLLLSHYGIWPSYQYSMG